MRWNGETNNETNILKSIFSTLTFFYAAHVTENIIHIYIDPGRLDLRAFLIQGTITLAELISLWINSPSRFNPFAKIVQFT